MSRNQFVHAVSVALLCSVPAPGQAEVNNQSAGDYSELDLTQDVYTEVDEAGDTDGSNSDGLLEGADDGAGPGYEAGMSDFIICDSRVGETGRRINISRSGSVITRNIQCD